MTVDSDEGNKTAEQSGFAAPASVEQALRESEYKLRQIIDTVPGLVWSNGPDGKPTHFNQRILDYSGMPSEEFMHRGWETFVHPADYPETAEAFYHAIETGTSYQRVMRLRRADGEFRWHHARCEPLRDQQGRIVQWYGLAVDIDERKQAEDRLRRSEAYLAEAERLSYTGSAAYTATEILYLSEGAHRLLGFNPLQGVPSREAVWQRFHPDDVDRMSETIERAVREKRSFGTEYRVVRPDGTIRHQESINHPVFSASGELLEIIATGIDLTERKRAQEAIRDSEYKLRQIIDTVPGFLWSVDPAGESTHVNQHSLDYYGMRFEDFKDRGWEACVHPADVSETATAYDHAFQTGTSYEGVMRLRRADGEFRWHHARCEPLRDPQGRIVQWYGLAVDIDERKQAEDRLRRSEAYLAEAQRLSHTGSAVYDETTIFYFSDETYRIFGFDPREGLPSREAAMERFHPGDRERVREEARKAVEQKRDYKLEYRILSASGTIKHIETNAHPKFSASGELVEVVTTIADVTERKRAEQALRESEARLAETQRELRQMIDTIPILMVGYSTDARRDFVNAAWKQYTGLSDETALGTDWSIVAHPDDLATGETMWRDTLATGQEVHTEVRLRRADGQYRWFAVDRVALRDESGKVLKWYATAHDIEQRKRAEQALQEAEASARSAIDGIAGIVSIHFPNGEVETVNRQCLEYFGRPLEWIKNWGTNDAVHPEDFPRVVEMFARAIASGIPFQLDQRLRRFDGQYRWFNNRGVPIRDDSGRIVRWYVLITDIEDRIRTLAQLEQMQSDFAHMNRVSTMGELVASLSHEITQPIASARIYARAAQNFLDMQPPDLGQVRETLAGIIGNAGRAGDIIDRVRDQIRKASPRKELFDLNTAIDEVLVLGRNAIIKNRVWVQTRLSEGLCPVHGDRVQLQQVLLNLFLNAVEAMGAIEAAPRELLISTREGHTGILVALQDSGPGIPPENLERVFDSFYTTKPSGMGMGLSICRSIIDAHGGRLWAERNEPRGTIFQFTLPAWSPQSGDGGLASATCNGPVNEDAG